MNAREAQRRRIYRFYPVIFQTARIMLSNGIMDMLRDSDNGMTIEEIAEKAELSVYAAKCLLEASLCIGLVLVDDQTDRFRISKTGWFLLNDPATRVNINFNHDVNYLGWFSLEEALKEGKPAGLKTRRLDPQYTKVCPRFLRTSEKAGSILTISTRQFFRSGS